MPLFNTSNPFKSRSSTTSSNRRSGRAGASSASSSQPPSRPTPAKPPPDPRLVSLSQLDQASDRFKQLKEAFVLPHALVFQPPQQPGPASSDAPTPKLDYTANNAPVHAYDEALTKLLISLDGIDSCGGDPDIRARRKHMVVTVENELERLDQIKKREYQRQIENGGLITEANLSNDGSSPFTVNQRSTSANGLPLPPKDYPSGAKVPFVPGRFEPPRTAPPARTSVPNGHGRGVQPARGTPGLNPAQNPASVWGNFQKNPM
ncbi:BAG family molecular chaperone regulator [Sporobolomyces koalae]|uniref:BAG family molecular chaperone regulator n=1 Tax=Sporobolomyces koalae TaxID=500713 RepID=UPI0031760C28